jgi:uncharacterized OB-fold protein
VSRKPYTTADSSPIWDGYEEGVLRLPYGTTTGKAFLPPGPISPYDLDEDIEWRPASGRGVIATFVVVRRPYFRDLPPPYVVVQVTLEEGPRLTANARMADLPKLHVGLPVTVTFEESPAGVVLPMFVPELEGTQ